MLDVQHSHEFSLEIDKYAIESIKDPKIIYNDMTIKRDLPYIDMYVDFRVNHFLLLEID